MKRQVIFEAEVLVIPCIKDPLNVNSEGLGDVCQ